MQARFLVSSPCCVTRGGVQSIELAMCIIKVSMESPCRVTFGGGGMGALRLVSGIGRTKIENDTISINKKNYLVIDTLVRKTDKHKN